VDKTQEDLELELATQNLAHAKARKDAALELQRQKAAAELQNRLAAEAKKRADDLLEYQAIVAKHEEKRRLAQEAENAAKREEAQKQKALADEAERYEQLQRERAAHAKRCADLAEAARREELEAEDIQRELLRTSTPVVIEPEINVKTNSPLSFLWRTEDGTPRVQPEPAPVPKPAAEVPFTPAPELRKDSPEETSALYSVFMSHGMRPYPLQLRQLLQLWSVPTVTKALAELDPEVFAKGINATFDAVQSKLAGVPRDNEASDGKE